MRFFALSTEIHVFKISKTSTLNKTVKKFAFEKINFGEIHFISRLRENRTFDYTTVSYVDKLNQIE